MTKINIINYTPVKLAFYVADNNTGRPEPYTIYISDIVWSLDKLILETNRGVYTATEAHDEVMSRIAEATGLRDVEAPSNLLSMIPFLSYQF